MLPFKFDDYINIKSIKMSSSGQLHLNSNNSLQTIIHKPQLTSSQDININNQKISCISSPSQPQQISNQEEYSSFYNDSQSQLSNVSFECDILDEHITTIKNTIQRYNILLSILEKQKNRQTIGENYQTTYEKQALLTYLQNLMRTMYSNKPVIVDAFNSFIYKQANFTKLLLHIYLSFDEPVIRNIFKIVINIWTFYFPKLQNEFSKQQMIHVAQSIARQIHQQEIMKLKSQYAGIKNQEWIGCHFQIMVVFVMTVVLVMEKYFHNPYFDYDQYFFRDRRYCSVDRQEEEDDWFNEDKINVKHKKVKTEESQGDF